jgi:hypothetical protein
MANKTVKYVLTAAIIAATCGTMFAAPVNIDVTATVISSSTLSFNILNISNNGAATALVFGSVNANATAWNNQPAQYVKISVSNNNGTGWRLKTYTDNYSFIPDTSTYGFQYGGLKGTVLGAKIPMGWLVNTTVLAGGPGLGNPVDSLTNGWTFLKDTKDKDDPATIRTVDPKNTAVYLNDESFANADLAGYTNIAFGGPSFTSIVRPNLTAGNESLATSTTPFYFYAEGSFIAAPSTVYTGALKLELINL